ncbi:hypothetical protein LMG3412_06491 [Achromobacter deleyi]|nr:hypothetical protein LMG3412_06491 [Achromobacter deleyi]
MSPAGAWIKPLLTARPAWLAALRRAETSLPRVVDKPLASDASPRRMMKVSPAANVACPPGADIWPALWASRPSSST